MNTHRILKIVSLCLLHSSLMQLHAADRHLLMQPSPHACGALSSDPFEQFGATEGGSLDPLFSQFLRSNEARNSFLDFLEKQKAERTRKEAALEKAAKEAAEKESRITEAKQKACLSFSTYLGITLESCEDLLSSSETPDINDLLSKKSESTSPEQMQENLNNLIDATCTYIELITTQDDQRVLAESIFTLAVLTYAKNHTEEQTLAFIQSSEPRRK